MGGGGYKRRCIYARFTCRSQRKATGPSLPACLRQCLLFTTLYARLADPAFLSVSWRGGMFMTWSHYIDQPHTCRYIPPLPPKCQDYKCTTP